MKSTATTHSRKSPVVSQDSTRGKTLGEPRDDPRDTPQPEGTREKYTSSKSLSSSCSNGGKNKETNKKTTNPKPEDKSKRSSQGGNGKSSPLGKDLGSSGSPGARLLSPKSPRELPWQQEDPKQGH